MASGLRRAVHYQAYRKVGCLNRKCLEIAYAITLTRVISPHKWRFAERKGETIRLSHLANANVAV